ncbi:hypothetical protein HY486_01605, partial [Candidatus Woesearchaeota archaeon]|nr:hypothetical protein [Candidatus Woesearchaeota archaeon]
MKEGVWRPGFVRALLLGGVSFGAVIAAYLLRDSAVQEASQKYQEAKTNLE